MVLFRKASFPEVRNCRCRSQSLRFRWFFVLFFSQSKHWQRLVLLHLSCGVHDPRPSHTWIQLCSSPNGSYRSSCSGGGSTAAPFIPSTSSRLMGRQTDCDWQSFFYKSIPNIQREKIFKKIVLLFINVTQNLPKTLPSHHANSQ